MAQLLQVNILRQTRQILPFQSDRRRIESISGQSRFAMQELTCICRSPTIDRDVRNRPMLPDLVLWIFRFHAIRLHQAPASPIPFNSFIITHRKHKENSFKSERIPFIGQHRTDEMQQIIK